MKTSFDWIKTCVPGLDVSPQEYADAMTLSGSKVEGFVRLDQDLDKIIVGQIEKIERHPDADKLVVCQVNVGAAEMVQIVTGAPNVEVGQKVPVVLDGGRVAGGHDGSRTPGGIKIKKGKLRGVVSNGMLCSIEELGSDRNMYPEAPKEGIYVFDAQERAEEDGLRSASVGAEQAPLALCTADAARGPRTSRESIPCSMEEQARTEESIPCSMEDVPIGGDALEYLGLHDVVFEYEITSNRVDCFGVLGIAREAAATFGKEFCPPQVTETGNQEDVNDFIKVRVEDVDLCPRYCARVVKNIKIAPSPKWLQRRLSAHGIRPINNVVDITNYVMEEYGQPMHAYDLSTIAGNEIIVRRAAKGEKFVTLDGQERHLDDSIVMICDRDKAVGIGGIMGGENSMITDQVTTMLFEAANFDGTNIRLSSKKLGMRTDASGKFEKGLDPNNAMDAINRACQLMEELGAGEVVGGVVDVYGKKREGRRVPFDAGKINVLLGTDIARETMLGYFEKIGLGFDAAASEVVVPSWRQDLECMADLAEEVARFYGYDNIPVTLPKGEATTGKLSFKLRVEKIAQDVAEFCGFSQGMTYSFESPKVFDKLLLPQEDALRQAVVISNPLGEDFSIMRTISLNGMLTSLSANYNRRNKDVRLYELGNVYLPKQVPVTELPDERMQLTLGFYGEGDFYAMKGVAEELFDRLGMMGRRTYVPDSNKPFLHPGRQANILYKGQTVGYLGEAHPQVADNYSIKDRVYLAVIDMPKVVEYADFDRKYQGIAKYPAISRDISMVVPKGITAGDIEQIFDDCGGQYLESYQLFDIYEGAQIQEGCKSVAYSITFRAKDRTLKEEDIVAPMDKILDDLKKMGIELRQ